MIKATWGMDYDYRNDKCYDAVMHEECGAPVGWCEEEQKYICVGCGEEAVLDDDMLKWLKKREGKKVKIGHCMSCGKKTMRMHYHRNYFTTEWEAGYGECEECGMKIII